MTPSLIMFSVAALAGIGMWLAWSVVRRSQRRQRAIRELLDAADALEASLRTAREEIEAVAGDHVNPVRAAMQESDRVAEKGRKRKRILEAVKEVGEAKAAEAQAQER